MSACWRAGALLLVLVVALSSGGCGGSDAPKTKEEFIAEADTVCERLAASFAKAGSTNPQTPDEIGTANSVLAELYDDLARDLSDLTAPPGTAGAGARDYIAAIQRSDTLVQRMKATSLELATAAHGRDPRRLAKAGNDLRSALDAFRAARAEADRLAVDYGFNTCGNLS